MEKIDFAILFSYAEECLRTFSANKDVTFVIGSKEEIVVYATIKDSSMRFGKNRLTIYVRRSGANDCSVLLGYQFTYNGDPSGCFCSYCDFASIKAFFVNLERRFDFEPFVPVQFNLF